LEVSRQSFSNEAAISRKSRTGTSTFTFCPRIVSAISNIESQPRDLSKTTGLSMLA
jgi:hypothetical protein